MARDAYIVVTAIAVALGFGCIGCDDNGSDDTEAAEDAGGGGGPPGVTVTAAYPANGCVAVKQSNAGWYCGRALEAWAWWESDQDDRARDGKIADALSELKKAWAAAEGNADEEGSNCSDQALTATEAADLIDDAVADLAESINGGMDLGEDAQCGADLLSAAAVACNDLLVAESEHVADPGADADRSALAADREAVLEAFSTAWAKAAPGSCSTDVTEKGIRDQIEQAVDDVVSSTIVAVHLDDSRFTTISPTGTTQYLGKEITPICMDGSAYHFFVKRGTVNKLLMYYQGGGACWEDLTCSIATCDTDVTLQDDDPNNRTEGFADRENPDNPFRDWHQVFISYCSCDVHFGDAAQDYPTHVEHRGFHNSRYAEKWAREHFLDPEVVFVTGTSAGSYGALFSGSLLQYAWPASQFHILGDAGNGVITPEFLNNELSNWDFISNLPEDVPGVREALTGGGGMVAFLEAAATRFPDTNWANYSTAYDGGAGGQTGFYNIMLKDSDPIAAVTWWEGSCAFNEQMRLQATQAYERIGSNYRYYIGTGSKHGMWGNDKVYDDTTGGVPTIVDWINAMLRSGPDGRDPDWVNVECTNCGLTLPGDPAPDPPEPPFEQQDDDLVIVCE